MIPRPFPPYPKKLDSRGRLRIRIGRKDYYLPKPLGSRASIEEYNRLRLAHAVAETKPVTLPAKPGKSVADLVAAWVDADPRGPDNAEVRHIRRAALVLNRLFGESPADEFRANRLRAVQEAMITGSWRTPDEWKGAKTWQRTYINKSIERIVRIFGWGESTERVPFGTVAHLRTVPDVKANDPRVTDPPQRQAVDWETQVKPCLRFLSDRVAAMVQIQFYAGMRPQDIRQMRRSEIIKDGPADCWLYIPTKHKGTHRGQKLTKIIGPKAQALLAPWLMAADPDGFVFPPMKARYKRGHYASEGYGRAVARACQLAKVKHWTPYQLRHLAKREATRAAGLDAARAFLGQTSLGATMEYDQAIDLEMAAKVARKIG